VFSSPEHDEMSVKTQIVTVFSAAFEEQQRIKDFEHPVYALIWEDFRNEIRMREIFDSLLFLESSRKDGWCFHKQIVRLAPAKYNNFQRHKNINSDTWPYGQI